MNTRLPLPKPGDINSGLSFLHPATAEDILGFPTDGVLGDDCGKASAALTAKLVTANVGPFKVTAHKQAVASLTAIFSEIKAAKPAVYAHLGTEGVMCVRRIRGTKNTPSNHSWGIAIDITVGGVLVPLGEAWVTQGLLDIYPFFHAHGWYWGAGFHRPDPMHFEVADETLRDWHASHLA